MERLSITELENADTPQLIQWYISKTKRISMSLIVVILEQRGIKESEYKKLYPEEFL